MRRGWRPRRGGALRSRSLLSFVSPWFFTRLASGPLTALEGAERHQQAESSEGQEVDDGAGIEDPAEERLEATLQADEGDAVADPTPAPARAHELDDAHRADPVERHERDHRGEV